MADPKPTNVSVRLTLTGAKAAKKDVDSLNQAISSVQQKAENANIQAALPEGAVASYTGKFKVAGHARTAGHYTVKLKSQKSIDKANQAEAERDARSAASEKVAREKAAIKAEAALLNAGYTPSGAAAAARNLRNTKTPGELASELVEVAHATRNLKAKRSGLHQQAASVRSDLLTRVGNLPKGHQLRMDYEGYLPGLSNLKGLPNDEVRRRVEAATKRRDETQRLYTEELKHLADETRESTKSSKKKRRAEDLYSSYIRRFAATHAVQTLSRGFFGMGTALISGGADGLAQGLFGAVGSIGGAISTMGRERILTSGRAAEKAAAEKAAGSGGGKGGGIAGAMGALGGWATFGVGLAVEELANLASAAYDRGRGVREGATARAYGMNASLAGAFQGAPFSYADWEYGGRGRQGLASDLEKHRDDLPVYGFGVSGDVGQRWSNRLYRGPAGAEVDYRLEQKRMMRHRLRMQYALGAPGLGMTSADIGAATSALVSGSGMLGARLLDLPDTSTAFGAWGFGAPNPLASITDAIALGRSTGTGYGAIGQFLGQGMYGGVGATVGNARRLIGAAHNAGIGDTSSFLSSLAGLTSQGAKAGLTTDVGSRTSFINSLSAAGVSPGKLLTISEELTRAGVSASDALSPAKGIASSIKLALAAQGGGSLADMQDRLRNQKDTDFIGGMQRMGLPADFIEHTLRGMGMSGSDAKKAMSAKSGGSDAWFDPAAIMRAGFQQGELLSATEQETQFTEMSSKASESLRQSAVAIDKFAAGVHEMFASYNTSNPAE